MYTIFNIAIAVLDLANVCVCVCVIIFFVELFKNTVYQVANHIVFDRVGQSLSKSCSNFVIITYLILHFKSFSL